MQNQSKPVVKFFFIVVCLLIAVSVIFPRDADAKTVYIPEEIKVEENAVKVTTIRNMSEIDAYRCFPIYIIDDFIYLSNYEDHSIVKLSLQGKVVKRFGKKGEGPGELSGVPGISKFRENIAIIDKYKVIICDKDLKYLKEIRLKQRYQNLILTTDNKIFLYNNPSYHNYYFTVFSSDFKYLKKFGIKKKGAKEIKEKDINFGNYKYSWDVIRETLYVPEDNGIWVSFRNRYDLRYYKNEKVIVDIKSRAQMFASTDDVFSGMDVKRYTDYPLLIAKHENNLYYSYVKGANVFCDIFDLSENYRLHRRIKLPFPYKQIEHSNSSMFYGLRYSTDKEDVFLDKIQIN